MILKEITSNSYMAGTLIQNSILSRYMVHDACNSVRDTLVASPQMPGKSKSVRFLARLMSRLTNRQVP